MKRGDFFKDKCFKVETFGSPLDLTIAGVHRETFEMDGQKETKPTMTFRETETAWIISPTAFDRLSDQIGTDETDDWVGVSIQLFVDHDATFNNKPCPQFRADMLFIDVRF
jgi:hypothetical protein